MTIRVKEITLDILTELLLRSREIFNLVKEGNILLTLTKLLNSPTHGPNHLVRSLRKRVVRLVCGVGGKYGKDGMRVVVSQDPSLISRLVFMLDNELDHSYPVFPQDLFIQDNQLLWLVRETFTLLLLILDQNQEDMWAQISYHKHIFLSVASQLSKFKPYYPDIYEQTQILSNICSNSESYDYDDDYYSQSQLSPSQPQNTKNTTLLEGTGIERETKP